jgi:hypothetical protein
MENLPKTPVLMSAWIVLNHARPVVNIFQKVVQKTPTLNVQIVHAVTVQFQTVMVGIITLELLVGIITVVIFIQRVNWMATKM